MNIFCSHSKDSIARHSETEIISKIQEWLGPVNPAYPMGIGDDCAVLSTYSTKNFLVTTDCIIAKEHFFLEDSPTLVGAKLLKRNLSDIAAMGGVPKQALLSIITGSNTRFEWFKEFIQGLKDTALLFNTCIVGGDLAAGPDSYFSASITLFGESNRPLLRKTTQLYDHIFVTGVLGGSILGHHLSFTPRIQEGQYLSQHLATRAMIDISDGIAKDLPELLSKQMASYLIVENIPISDASMIESRKTGQSPLYHALCDGEDYELLFTVDAKYPIEKFIQEWNLHFTTPLAHIGTVVPQKAGVQDKVAIHFHEKGKLWKPPFKLEGFEHWKNSKEEKSNSH